MNSIGERIRFSRKANHLTLTDVNKLTGLSIGNLSELENNKFMPSTNALLAFKKLFQVSIDWLLTGKYSNEMTTNPQIEVSDITYESGPVSFYSLSSDEQRLIESYQGLSVEDQRAIWGFISVASKKYAKDKTSPLPKQQK
ncbi:transcriptional regulator, XRE family [Alkaliphilus metalliredigens QYMF]|uniref:Transcriptional regulator, XRE family n=1 Tax=Alkaliphilus metalliredigens (strain QYMF) TaxID=293826 RepID=A6TJP3_ALKMQ|nr:helix-turn-helix transcriptional regulator [Alkaliphilus metalliredigens]ABR46411.1 transcriptional regulator, XRE family [Alkaliphilus metalliredigens QYMF]